ncbi:HlyD family type I secretion periplasmic adaptor subunit [Dinoroseobacter sp. PD6]|uniref:HlyD family type I secretion periplasmic adaptor subunit n=1 Tax=Dinoroseobacter sp. PD6 TaxID=3028384 RepID=UPI00237AB73B|nr:HlyD family type I secretion periplasmic adaptor subunit [Dinoroseobacter sp. PD6]MDD9716247.1 HlyD family type I secretion periplasmic adaptor subunit [Dinoroseobacter sp. PD6]
MNARDWQLEEFAIGAEASRMARPRRGLTAILLLIIALAGVGLVWAGWATIEEVSRADGRVVPSGSARGVETLEGGLVAEILVAEGDRVAAGQELVRIDDTGASADLGELAARRAALRARALRLEAELGDAAAVDFAPAGLAADDPLALRERALFDSRRASYVSQRAVLEAQVLQRRQEITELTNGLARSDESLALLDEEIAIRENSGVIPRAQIIPVERERTGMRSERDRLDSRRAQAEAALMEAEARLTELDLLRRAEINAERSQTLNDLAIILESIRRAEDVVTRAALRAPVTGVVSALNVSSQGEVVTPGEEVLRVVPEGTGLEIEARLRPEDIAFVRPGLPAKVKITAFDFTIYGALPGHVVRVGADAEQDDSTGETFFPIIIQTEETQLTRGQEVLEIRPGMVASVDILTGERKVLDYLLKPFRKARAEALRER